MLLNRTECLILKYARCRSKLQECHWINGDYVLCPSLMDQAKGSKPSTAAEIDAKSLTHTRRKMSVGVFTIESSPNCTSFAHVYEFANLNRVSGRPCYTVFPLHCKDAHLHCAASQRLVPTDGSQMSPPTLLRA